MSICQFVSRIYSDIHLCKFFDTNIFGYSFVSKFLRMSHSGMYLDPGEDIWRQWRTLGSPVLPGVENNLGNIMIGAKMRKFNDRRKNETNEQK